MFLMGGSHELNRVKKSLQVHFFWNIFWVPLCTTISSGIAIKLSIENDLEGSV